MAKTRKTPRLPVQQLVILSLCRFAEPVALTSVFPYLPEMIESFHVPKNEVAKWAGITSAVFSLSQCLTGIAWGQASDRYGRKPIIILGLICTMLASLLFGFSRSLPWAIVARSFAGASNGNVGIMRTTVAEMVPQRELQPRAFSIMPLVWTIGSIFGPAFGGALANPAARHPKLFGDSKFFEAYPFALPNLVSSVLFLMGLTVGILFLKETLETKKHRRDYGRVAGEALLRLFIRNKHPQKWRHNSEQESSLLKRSRVSSASTTQTVPNSAVEDGSNVSKPPAGYREVFSRQSNINLLSYSLLAMHSVTYDQLLPVLLHLPEQKNRASNIDVHLPFKFAGGFDVDSSRIGLLFTFYGIFGMLIQFTVFPPLARRYGVLRSLRVVTLLFPIVYILTPFTVLLPTPLTQQIGIFTIMLLKCWAVIFAFPCTTILLTNSAVSLRILGTLNGVATSISAIGRAAGPALGGATFTLGIEKGYIILPWFTLACIAGLGALPAWWIIEMEGFGGGNDNSDSDDSESEDEEQTLVPNTPNTMDGSDGEGSLSATTFGVDPVTKKTVVEVALDGDDGLSDFSCQNTDSMVPEEDGYELSVRPVQKRMSSPIGMREPVGPGGGARLSNGLGQTRSGFEVAGTSF